MGIYLAGNAANQPTSLASGASITAASNISGQTVYLISGHNEVQGTFTAQVSGQPVRISGQTVRTEVFNFTSGNWVEFPATVDTVAGAAPIPIVQNLNYAFDRSVNSYNRLEITSSGQGISGQARKLVVTFSGDSIIGSVSGNMVSISGQPVSISGQTVVANVTTNISGQTIYLISGNNAVQMSGQAVRISGSQVNISGQTSYPVSGKSYNQVFDPLSNAWLNVESVASGAGAFRVGIGGPSPDSIIATVLTPSTDTRSTANNSLNTLSYLHGFVRSEDEWSRIPVTASGRGVSGAHHRLIVDFSGCPVSISGQTVVTSVSGIAINISGNTIYTASGNNQTQVMVYDPSGNALRPLIVTQSGGNTLRVAIGSASVPDLYVNIQDGGSDSISTTVDGLASTSFTRGYDQVTNQWKRVRVTASGQGMSGIVHKLPVAFSGDVVSISGQPVSISGQTVVASVVTNISGQTVYTTSGQNDVQISGQTVIALISGQTVVANVVTNISGQTVVAEISGQPVLISGQVVRISGSPVTVSGNVVNTSGNVAVEYGTAIRTNVPTVITSLSGGTELSSGVVFAVTIRNASGNAPMFVGGTGAEAPFSGKGMILFGNESQTYKVDNFNKVRLFARTSGQLVYFNGVAQ